MDSSQQFLYTHVVKDNRGYCVWGKRECQQKPLYNEQMMINFYSISAKLLKAFCKHLDVIIFISFREAKLIFKYVKKVLEGQVLACFCKLNAYWLLYFLLVYSQGRNFL